MNTLVFMLTGLCPEVETSAEQARRSLARAFGADNVRFEFLHEGQKAPEALLV